MANVLRRPVTELFVGKMNQAGKLSKQAILNEITQCGSSSSSPPLSANKWVNR
jgi:hypothetical protein